MTTALFTNFTDQEFTGYWNGKGKTFKPHQSLYMPEYLARHFAKHLVNKELLRKDDKGNSVYKDGEKFTSPKKPEDVPLFMELFNKAFQLEVAEDELGEEETDIDTLIETANKNKAKLKEDAKKEAGPTEPQTILPPDFDDDEDDSEESFGGKPVENDTVDLNSNIEVEEK